MRRRTIIGLACAAATSAAAAPAGAAIDAAKPYAVGVQGGGYETRPLISSGDTIPYLGAHGKYDAKAKAKGKGKPTPRDFQFVGIPDGLGAHGTKQGNRIVYVNHELTSATHSEPIVGGPLQRGAFVSQLLVDEDGQVLAGRRAFDWVYDENTFVGPAATTANDTRAFSRFCSAFLAGPEVGFDRYIYITNEEEGTAANSFDGKGGLAVAITGNRAYGLPKLGRFAWENALVQPTDGDKTVIMGMEDGPADLTPANENSQLYMYVGTKNRSKRATVLGRNGLDNGKLYVLAPAHGAGDSEAAFTSGTIIVKWVEIPNAGALTETELEAASDAVGAFRFARPEDGAFNSRNANEYFFVTTGGAAGANVLGRLYSLFLHPDDPTKGGVLTVVYNADAVIAGGGDVAISPDNVDVSDDYLMVQEDGTAESRPVMAAKAREGSIWRFPLQDSFLGVDHLGAQRVVELDPPGRDNIPVPVPGTWETSGIIDTDGLFGTGTWLFDVQAHAPTTAPGVNTVEDGQLLLLEPTDA